MSKNRAKPLEQNHLLVTGKGREEEGGGNLKSFGSFQWAILFKVHTPPDWALDGGRQYRSKQYTIGSIGVLGPSWNSLIGSCEHSGAILSFKYVNPNSISYLKKQ